MEVVGDAGGKDDGLKASEKKEKEDLARIVERFAKLSEEKRRALGHAVSYRKPHKYLGIVCEVCGERFSAWRSDKKTCDKYRCQKAHYRRGLRGF